MEEEKEEEEKEKTNVLQDGFVSGQCLQSQPVAQVLQNGPV